MFHWGSHKGSAFVFLIGLFLLTRAMATAAVTGSLTFRDPAGVVGPTDTIPVWVTLTLDATSDPIITDANGMIVSGPDLSEFATINSSYTNISFVCTGTFTTGCGGPPYTFGFNHAAPSLLFAKDLNVQPGDSEDFLFGTFTPSHGPVAPGTYQFYRAILFVNVEGTDSSGTPAEKEFNLFSICKTGDNTCAFERTVVAQAVVPEPSSLLLVLPAVLGGALLRRRAS